MVPGSAGSATADVPAINRRILGIIQVESPSAVEHVAEIAAIDGVDVLFVGPTDLSHSLGVPGRFDDPTYLDALDRVTAAAEAAGKAAGILLYDAGRHRTPPRARVPVHRSRRGQRVRGVGRARDAGRRPRLIVARPPRPRGSALDLGLQGRRRLGRATRSR